MANEGTHVSANFLQDENDDMNIGNELDQLLDGKVGYYDMPELTENQESLMRSKDITVKQIMEAENYADGLYQ